MSFDLLIQYAKAFFRTSEGQATLAFVRVALATVFGCWANAGFPVSQLESAALVGWVDLAIKAAAALVLANYIGPWERRYGRNGGKPE